MDELRELLGADMPDELLRLALSHPSAVGEGMARTLKSNQRLEFLGDAIVGAVMAAHLYRAHPDLPEGVLTQRKAAAVRGSTLARAAGRLGLGRHLILGRGEENGGGRAREGILADAFESLTGALFLHAGYDAAAAWVLRALGDELEATARNAVNVKNLLQERTQAVGLGTPVYKTAQLGAGPSRKFSSEVFLMDALRGRGQGGSKKEAEERAAQAAMDGMTESNSG